MHHHTTTVWRSRFRHALLAATGSLLAAGAVGLPATAAQAQSIRDHAQQPIRYTIKTLDDAADPTFNQLLGINDNGVIAGYFGIGSASHPNKGYVLDPPYGQGNYLNETPLSTTPTQTA